MQQEPLVVPHNPEDNPGKDLSYASDLNNSTNPIDKAISSLRYSSIPHFMFESHSKPNSYSTTCVMRSENGWFEDSEENVGTDPTVTSKTIAGSRYTDSFQNIDSDTDSSSLAPYTSPEGEDGLWLQMTEDAVGGCHWEEGKLSRLHENKVRYLTKDPTVPQNIPLKGMARLRRISPRAIKTAILQNTSNHDPDRANTIGQGDLAETKELKVAAGKNIKVPLPLGGSNTSPVDQGRHRKTNRLMVTKP